MTTPTETSSVSSTPRDQVDLDSKEAMDMLEAAFNEALPASSRQEAPAAAQEAPKTEEDRKVTQALDKVEEAKPSTPVAQAQATEDKPTTYNGPEWAKDLPDNVRSQVDKLIEERRFHEQKWKSDVGRQNALQQKLFQARRQAEELRAKIQQRSNDQSFQTAAQGDEAKTLTEWKQLNEADPNLAKAIELRLAQERESLRAEMKGQIDATVDPLYQHTEESYVDQQQRLLEAEVPNYREVVNSPVYKFWLDNVASPGVKDLAYKSNEYTDAVTVLRVYANEAQGVYQHMVQQGWIEAPPQQQAAPVEQAQQAAASNTRADKVAQSRQQKVQAAPVVQHSPNPISAATVNPAMGGKPGDAVDLDNEQVQALFEAEFAKARGPRAAFNTRR